MDLRCFLETLSALFGFSASESDYDWDAVAHATDPGLLRAAFDQHAGRPPTGAETRRFVARFVAALEAAAAERPADFRPIGGARELVAALDGARDWDFAVATGCWEESARLKLDLAGLATAGGPLASASEAVSREEIFGLALARASSRADRPANGPAAVLVGDGTWDALTARRLGLPFVGVARGDREAALRRLGAAQVLPDFRDLDAALAALGAAARRREERG